MADYSLKLKKGTGTNAVSTQDHSGQGVFFTDGDTLSIGLKTNGNNSFSNSATIKEIKFFKTSAENAANKFQTVEAGANDESVSCDSGELFTVTIDGATASIADSEASQSSDEHIWYKVIVDDGGTNYKYDPELINTGTTDTRRGWSALTSGDSSTTL